MLLASAFLLAGAGIASGGAWIYLKAELAQWLLARSWEEQLATGARTPPWPWADTWPLARLRSERLGIDQYVLAGASGRNLAFGPTHVAPSAEPGVPGHTVISGHRDTHFRFLAELSTGDELLLDNGAQRRRYRVVASEVVDLEHEALVLRPEEDWLTLVTCYPLDGSDLGGSRRYLVHALPLEPAARPTRVSF